MSTQDPQKTAKKRIRKRWLAAATLINLFFVITLLIHAPIETFVGNASEFWFRLTDLLPIMAVCAGGALIVLELLVLMLPTVGIKIVSGFVFAFTLCSYLQVNFLNPDYGALGTVEIDWANPGISAYLTAAMWGILCIGIPVTLVLVRKKIMRTVLKGASLLLSLMQIVSVVLLLVTNPNVLNTSDELVLTRDGIYEIGEEDGNILVFMLDTTANCFLDTALETNPALTDAFDGFTRFTNSTGSYTRTHGAVPYMISGIRYLNQCDLSSHLEDAYAESQLLQRLADNQYHIGFYLGNIFDDAIEPYSDNASTSTIRITDPAALYSNYMKLICFRTMPEMVKEHFYIEGASLDMLQSSVAEITTYVLDDPYFYQNLLDSRVQSVQGKTFRFIRMLGALSPFTMDENALHVDSSDQDTQMLGSIKILSEYFDQMKQAGVYDNTAIIVLGDHGHANNGDSIFLAKPMNSRGELKTSNAPISHEDLHNTIFDLAGLEAVDYGKSAFDVSENEQRVRTAYLYSASDWDLYLPDYLAPLWQVEYTSDVWTPRHTGVIYDKDGTKTFDAYAATIEFGRPYMPSDFDDWAALEGFSWGDPESTYIWMNMYESRWFFKVPSIPENGIDVTMEFITWMPVPSNRLKISVANTTVFDQTFEWTMQDRISFHIPAECIDADTGLVVLAFETPDAFYDIPNCRVMSFGPKSITINPAE